MSPMKVLIGPSPLSRDIEYWLQELINAGLEPTYMGQSHLADLPAFWEHLETTDLIILGLDPLVNDALLDEAGETALTEVDPPFDVHGSAEYRREMVKVFVKRVGRIALERARAA